MLATLVIHSPGLPLEMDSEREKNDAALGEDLIGLVQVHDEPAVKSRAVGDDVDLEAASTVQGFSGSHGQSVPERWLP